MTFFEICSLCLFPAEDSGDKPTERPTGMSTEMSREIPTAMPTEQSTDKPADRPTEELTERPIEDPSIKGYSVGTVIGSLFGGVVTGANVSITILFLIMTRRSPTNNGICKHFPLHLKEYKGSGCINPKSAEFLKIY